MHDERVARRYQRGRALSVEVLERWRAAEGPHVASGAISVVDIGAHTATIARRHW
jgi:hypothetical protein